MPELMSELNLEGLFEPAEYSVEQDVAERIAKAKGEDPCRGTLAGLFVQRRQLLDELRDKLKELVELNKQIELRAHAVIVNYTGIGRLGRWLHGRAWRRIFSHHDVSLSSLLGDMPRGHCADRWECVHRDGLLCDDVCKEQHNLDKLARMEKLAKMKKVQQNAGK